MPLIGPTTDPTQEAILDLGPPEGPLDPNAPPFDLAWWASQPPAVAAMQNFSTGNPDDDPTTIAAARREAAKLLAQTYLVDWDIVGLGQGPYQTMAQRCQNQDPNNPNSHWTWVPSALQDPVPVGPGAHVPGLPDYNPDPPYPANSVIVSNNAAFFLPYQAPASS